MSRRWCERSADLVGAHGGALGIGAVSPRWSSESRGWPGQRCSPPAVVVEEDRDDQVCRSVRWVARSDVMGVAQCQQGGGAAREAFRRLRGEQKADVVAAVDAVLHAADKPGGSLVQNR